MNWPHKTILTGLVCLCVLAGVIFYVSAGKIENERTFRGELQNLTFSSNEWSVISARDLYGPYWDRIMIVQSYAPIEVLSGTTDSRDQEFSGAPLTNPELEEVFVATFQGDIVCSIESLQDVHWETVVQEYSGQVVCKRAIAREAAQFEVMRLEGTEFSDAHFRLRLFGADGYGNVENQILITDTQKLPRNPTGVCGPDYEALRSAQ